MTPEDYILQVKEKFGTQTTRDGQLIRDMNDRALLKRMIARYPDDATNIVGLDAYLSEEERQKLPPQPDNPVTKAIGDAYKRVSERVGAKVQGEWLGAFEQGREAVARGAERFAEGDGTSVEGQVDKTGALLESGLGVASAGVRGLFAPLTAVIQETIETASDDPNVQKAATSKPVGETLDTLEWASEPVREWAKANPDAARNLVDAFTVATAGVGEGATGTLGATRVGALSRTVADEAVGAARAGTRVATETVTGAVDDATRAARELAAKKREELQSKAVDELEATYEEILTGTVSKNKKFDRSQSAARNKNKAGTEGQPPQRILAEQGIIPNQEGSRFRTTDQAEVLRRKIAPLREANRRALREVQQSTDPADLYVIEEMAKKMAQNSDNVNAGTAKDLVKEIEQEFANLREQYGDTVVLTTADDIKSARWGQTKFDSTRPFRGDGNYLIGKSFQQYIEDAARGAGFEDVAQLNRVIGDRLEAARTLQSLDGQTVKGGRLGRYMARISGGILGAPGGTLGSILGMAGGDMVANILISNSVAGPVKRLILKGMQESNPVAYDRAVKWLEDKGLERDMQLRLPAGDPSISPLNNGLPIQVAPAGARIEYTGPGVVATAGPSGVAKTAAQMTKANGGITITKKGDIPEDGFAFAPRKDTERIIPADRFSDKDIDSYMQEFDEVLAMPGAHFGSWVDDGKVYMDVSIVAKDFNEAMRLAEEADQLAVFDLSAFETHYLNDYEKSSGSYTRRGENSGTAQEGDANAAPGEGRPEGPEGGAAVIQEEVIEPEGFSSGAVPQTALSRDPSLSGEAAEVQERSIAKYEADPEGMVETYLADNGNVVNTDEARKYFTDVGYRGSNSAAVHSASKAIATRAFNELLSKSEPGQHVYFMAGGSGAGKSTATKVLEEEMRKAAMVVDGNLSKYDSARKQIKQVEDAGLNVTIPYVFREPRDAWVNGVIKRMLDPEHPDFGRVVPLKTFIENTTGALDVVRRLASEGIPYVGFKKMPGEIDTPISMDELKELSIPVDIENKLIQETERLARDGAFTKEQYDELLRGLPHTEFDDLQKAQ